MSLVERHEAMVFRRPPVPDSGIDLSRNRPRGINGYEADRLRREALAARRAKLWAACVEKALTAPEIEKVRLSHSNEYAIASAPNTARTVRGIQRLCCQLAGTTPKGMLSRARTSDVVRARHIGMMLSRMLCKRSFPQIGRDFGNRDHTSVLHVMEKTAPLQAMLLETLKPGDEISVWVSAAFRGWDELGFK